MIHSHWWLVYTEMCWSNCEKQSTVNNEMNVTESNLKLIMLMLLKSSSHVKILYIITNVIANFKVIII